MKKITLILILFQIGLFISCTTHHIYFDIKKQELISCNTSSLYDISIEYNSKSLYLIWNDSIKEAPHTLDLNNIPIGYDDNFADIKNFKLMANTLYTISKSGAGRNPHYIRIWTNRDGIVYKTTSLNCNCGDGDDGIPTDWVAPSNQSQ